MSKRNIADAGVWVVVWLTKKQKFAHAFFSTRDEALTHVAATGGELYLKHADGSLQDNG